MATRIIKKKSFKTIIFIAMVMMQFTLICNPVSAYYSNTSKDSESCNHGSCKKKKISGSSYCSAHTCAQKGCYKEVSSANARCSKHKAEYYAYIGISTSSHPITTCSNSGCSKTKAAGSHYCSSHTCSKGSCTYQTITGSKYCSFHTCAYPGCYQQVNSANQKCAAHKNAPYPSSGKRSFSSSRTSKGYSTSGYSDYEDFYEDHRDDFEGIDDAESYWEKHH